MTQDPTTGAGGPEAEAPIAETGAARPRRRRRWLRGIVRAVALFLSLVVAILAIAVIATLSIDLGPAAKGHAERAAANYLERDFSIGRLSIRLATGTFIVEDLVIGGLEPEHRPFLTARRIEVAMPLGALVRREVLLESIVMRDWNMLIETWPNGRHNFPRFTRERTTPPGPRRWVTTLRYVHARDGQFTYEDHGTPWSTVARNLDVVVRKDGEYTGTARFSNGTVQIQDFLPMQVEMRSQFSVDGALVRFSDLDLVADGSVSDITGVVDLGRWPEQTWNVRSKVDFPRMRQLFFAREPWRLSGTGEFTGTFHLFKGGRELKGTFASDLAGVNEYRFQDLRGALLWLPDRLEVTDARARVYGGTAQFEYRMGPLGAPTPAVARFAAKYRDVDLATFTRAIEMEGIRFAGRATGHNLLEWPLGRFAQARGDGHVRVRPPDDAELLDPAAAIADLNEDARFGEEWGPFASHAPLGYVPIGADFTYRFDPEWVTLAPGWFATRRTHVTFDGRTAYGERSTIPFRVVSADWQESGRLLAGILTAFGSPTGAVPVGGWGTFDGVMLGAFRDPRIEGRFSGERMRAWDVVWGTGEAEIAIEDGYVDVARSRVTHDGATIEAEGRFSLGYPRRDGGEELNARVRLTDRPLLDLRRAFGLDDYPMFGRVSGEFHVYDRYEAPHGFGKLRLDQGTAWGEPFETATASLRFEGAGVRVDGLEARKADGTITGAAYVTWAGTYSFNAQGRRIPLESVELMQYPEAPLSGLLQFTASGSGRFAEPRYDVRLDVYDLYVLDEGIGEVTGRIGIRNTIMTFEVEAASPRLAVSGTGRIALTPESDAELTFRFTDTSLDPYARLAWPGLSPFTTAVATGSLRVVGELRNLQHLVVDAVVDDLQARLFDYGLRNDGAIRLLLDNETVQVASLRLIGDNTSLNVTGEVAIGENRIALDAEGEANLGILQGFYRDIRSSGEADLRASVRGPLDAPVLAGTASIAGGRVRHFALPHSLDAVNGRIVFDADGARLDGLTGRLGGGLVRFGGRIGLAGYEPVELNVTASGEGMRLRYPEGFRSVVDAELALRGRFEAPLLSGSVLVRSSVLSRRIDLSPSFIELAGQGGAAALPQATAPTGVPLRFDVRLVAPSSLRIENNAARIVSSADLTLRGTYDRPLVFGRAEIERGEVLFEGRRYVVTRGTVDFSNPTRIEPFFDVETETRVRVPGQTYRVAMTATGTFSRLQFSLDSDPPLPNVEILGLLLSNTAPTDPELAQLRSPQATEQQLLQARAAQLLVSPLSAGVGRVVEQTFGVDSFQITPSLSSDPLQQSSRLNPSARLTIGKRLSSRAYLTFSQSLTQQSTNRDQVILLEYDQTDRLSWVLSQNEDRTYALEMRMRHAF
jgi:hypothetical protein